jgi:hypothetical protein
MERASQLLNGAEAPSSRTYDFSSIPSEGVIGCRSAFDLTLSQTPEILGCA